MKESGVEAREIAIQCLYRIDETDSFANIILPNLLKGKSLDQRDKNSNYRNRLWSGADEAIT